MIIKGIKGHRGKTVSIAAFFRRQELAYISIDTEGAERRDARPFVSFDTDGPRKAEPFMAFSTDMPRVKPLEANTEFEIFERDTKKEPAGEIYKATEALTENEEIMAYSETEVLAVAEVFEEPELLLLPMPEARKLLKAGKQPLLIAAPDELEVAIKGILETEKATEAQHIVYFSDVEMMDGAETITEAEADPMRTEKKHSFIGAKIIAVFMLLFGLTTILFPSLTLNAAKMQIDVNPTNTTPGLSLAISSNDMLVTTDPITSKQSGKLEIITNTNTLTTSTLDLDVSTTGADGYKLYATTSGTDKKNAYTNALVNKSISTANGEGAKINALAVDTTMSVFPAGYWGYTTDSSLQSSTIFKAFPVYDSTDTIKYGGAEIASANTAIAGNDPAGETPLTIGVNADNTLPSGEYTNDLLFTIIANPVTVTYNLNFDGNTTDSSLAGMPSTITETSADVYKNITIPNATPTRTDYIFKGWADTASATTPDYIYGDATKGEVTLQVTDINNSQVVNKTVYAVWEKKDYLQDFDADTELPNVGDTKLLWDKRDDQTYTVKRLPDGNVWMTQNLRLNGARTLTPADSDVHTNFSMPANVDVSNWCTTASCANTAQTYYDATTRESYGAIYNWSAATAGTGTDAITTGNVASSICPKGWRLPTSGAGGEFVSLDIALGGDGENRSNDLTSLAKYESVAGFDYPGAINSALTVVGEYGRWWSATATTSGKAYYMYLDKRTGNEAVYPYMNNAKTFGGSVRCIARSATNDNTKYMQDFNDAIDLRTIGDATTYVDNRDGEEYVVRRLSDGKVWMTQNLRYTQGASVVSENRNYGAYYNWATAMTVCPTGWHLPTKAEFTAMYADYNTVAKLTSTGTNGPEFTFAGRYNTTSLIAVGTGGYNWTTTQGQDFEYNSNTVWNTAAEDANWGLSVRCVGDQPNVFFMQDLDESTQLPNTGDSAILTDRRDQSTYTVKRLPDGKIWMTQNLRYMGTTSDPAGTPITSGSFVTANGSDSAGVTVNVTSSMDTSSAQAYYNRGDTSYGALYNWFAAMAVCPSGWHLPSRSEWRALDVSYGYTGTNRDSSSGHESTTYALATMKTQVSNYMSTTGNWPGITTTDEIYNRTLRLTDTSNKMGIYWSSEGNGYTANSLFHLADYNNRALVYPKYDDFLISDYVMLGVGVRCTADGDATVMFDANGGTGTMASQAFTKGIRQALSANTFTRAGYEFVGWSTDINATTPMYTDEQQVTFNRATTLYAVWRVDYMQSFNAKASLQNVGDNMMLMDNRDNEVYTVKRLPDGKVWMTQNLRYATGASEVSSNTDYGAYYNWSTALNVCPSGWHLPSSAEQVALDIAYGFSGETRTNVPDDIAKYMRTDGNWPGFVAAGYYNDASNEVKYAGTRFAYSSRTPDSDAGRENYMWYTTSSLDDFYPAYSNVKSYGLSVRCIANESETVSFDTNGGTGTMADITVEKGESVTLTNAFTKVAYNFAGWATSADGAVVYSDNAAINLSEGMTLYAVWTPVGDFLQDFNQDTQLTTVGASKTLYDNRDGRAYTVKRLPDGKVWMTQNLALGIDGAKTLTAADTNINDGNTYYLPPAGKQGSSTIDNASTLTATTAANFGESDDQHAKTQFHSKGNSITNDSDTGYYNLYTATLGSSYYNDGKTSGTATRDICPKGWHLPKVSDSGTTVVPAKNDMRALAVAYNGSASWTGTNTAGGTYYTQDATVRNGMYATAATSSDNYAGFSYTGIYTGATQSGTDNGFYWSGSIYDGTLGYTMRFDASSLYPQNVNAKNSGAAVRCVANYTEMTVSFNANGGSGTMAAKTVVKGQKLTLPSNTFTRTNYTFLGWSTSSTANAATYSNGATITVNNNLTLYAVWRGITMQNFECAKMSAGSTVTLKDTRDNQNYTVYSMPSGVGLGTYCMMTKDLGLGYVTSGSITRSSNLTLTTADSAGSDTIYYRNKSTWKTTNNSIQYVNGPVSGSESYSSHPYYSFSAAIVVCPKGWRLPTKTEFSSLISYAGGDNATGSAALRSSPYNFIYTGYFTDSGWNHVGEYGHYWASTPSGSSQAYVMTMLSNRVYPLEVYRYNARAVRCVMN